MFTPIHGYARTRDYIKWKSMKARCYNVNHPAYYNYGARGITVCDEWKDSYPNFLRDMGLSEPGTCLDRIDNNGGYSKENCRWTTTAVNNLNKRNVKRYEYQGKAQTIKEWCIELGISLAAVERRIRHHKWDIVKALETPIRRRKRTAL